MVLRFIVFLIINFAGLGLGSLFTGSGVTSEWYANLNKAPWTPPGWVFGFAWTTIMICFSLFMAFLWEASDNKKQLIILYVIALVLNIAWNPAFFYFNWMIASSIIIVSLTILIWYFQLNFTKQLGIKTLLMTPYAIWMLIASSLNLYILFKN